MRTSRRQGVTHIYESILAFFDEHSGLANHAGDVRDRGRGPSLLRTACMGNPERTIQGELFAYLRTRYERAVLEYRHHRFDAVLEGRWKNGRSIDIMVLDNDYAPLCAIELKHHSRMQSDLRPLLENLNQDRVRLDGLALPVIQVGVYTDLIAVPSAPQKRYESFRLISAYCYTRGIQKPIVSDADATSIPGAGDLQAWAEKFFDAHRLSLTGPIERFCAATGQISGRIHYLVALKHI